MQRAERLETVLNKAMALRPSERALLAEKLISSLDKVEDEIEQQWLALSEKRLEELKSGEVKPLTWKEIRDSIKKS